MDDLYNCLRIMQLSTEKLQSTRHAESLLRTSLIRSTFLQSRKQFSDLIYSLVKISSANPSLLPVMISNEDRSSEPTNYSWKNSPHKRKSCHLDTVKRIRLNGTSNAVPRIQQELLE